MFVIRKIKTTGEYKADLLAKNGQVILSSEYYTTKAACLNGIESIRRNSQREDAFERKDNSQGRPYFLLKAMNGQVIGISQYYESVAARENGIESVKRNAETVEIKEND